MRSKLLVFLLLTVVAGWTQDRPTVAAQANTVFAGADGKFEAPPDTAVLGFNVSVQDDTPKAAYAKATQAVESLRQILRNNGIDPATAEIGFFSIAPLYDWRNPQRKLIGYRVTSNVMLKLRDFAKVGPIVEQLATGNVSQNTNVGYALENMDAAKQKAVQDAFQRARANAAAVAQAGGKTLGDLSYASVDTFDQVRPMFQQDVMAMRAGAEAAPPGPTAEFTPQKVTVTAHVNAMFTLK